QASFSPVLQAHRPRVVAVSAATKQGLGDLQDAVIEMLSADFAHACVETAAGNGRVLSYLSAHAEIYRQEFHEDRVGVHCYLPRHLFHHIEGPEVEVRFLDGTQMGNGRLQAPSCSAIHRSVASRRLCSLASWRSFVP